MNLINNTETNSSLPEFEAKLKSKEFFDITKRNVDKFTAVDLRRVKDINDLKKLEICNGSNAILKYVNQYGLQNFAEFIQKNNSNYYYTDNYNSYLYTVDGHIKKLQPTLFEIEKINLLGADELLIIAEGQNSNGKPVVFTSTTRDFLKDGVKALSRYKGDLNNASKNTIYGPKDTTDSKFGDYYVRHINGETLNISKSGCLPRTIDGIGFDTMPQKGKIITKPVIANFKPDYAEFFSLKEVKENDTKQIRSEKYIHRGVEYVDYSRYGNCIMASLDPNKNFIVGIFDQGGKKSLKIIRVGKDADLMASFDDIDELVGFDSSMDVIVYDHDGNLRSVDANFNDFDMYLDDTISSLNTEGEGDNLDEVVGGCKTYPEMFAAPEFAKALGIVLKNNSLISKENVVVLLRKISAGELISTTDRDNLLSILSPGNPTLEKQMSTFIEKLRVHKPIGMKREAPLNNLLLQEGTDDPNSAGILAEYVKYVKTYPNTIEADTINNIGPFTDILKNGTHQLMVKQGDNYKVLLSEAEKITVTGQTADTITIEYVKNDTKGISEYAYDGTVKKTIIISDKYKQTPTINARGIGIVQDKSNSYREGFVHLVNDTIAELGKVEWNAINTVAGSLRFYTGGKFEGSNLPENYIIVPNKENLTDPIRAEKGKIVSGVFKSDQDTENILMESTDGLFLISASDKETKKQLIQANPCFLQKSNQYVESGYFSVRIGKNESTAPISSHQITKTGVLFNTVPLTQTNRGSRHIDGIDAAGYFRLYKFGPDEQKEITDGKLTLLGKTKKPVNGSICIDDKKEVVGYQIKEDNVEKLSGVGLLSALGVLDEAKLFEIKELPGMFFIKSNSDQIQLTNYKNVSHNPVPYGKLKYYRFQDAKTERYGIATTGKNEPRQEFLPATAITEPRFKEASFSFDGQTYNLNSKKEFVKLEHDFETLEAMDQAGWYLVSKKGAYGFARMNDGKIELTNGLSYTERPEMKDIWCVTKTKDAYLLLDLSGGIEKRKEYNLIYKPLLTHIGAGYIMFEIPNEGYTFTPLKEVLSGKTLHVGQCYTMIEERDGTNRLGKSDSYFRMIKKEGGCDFLVDGKVRSTADGAKDLQEIHRAQQINDDQRVIDGGAGTYDHGLYFNHKGSIQKLSSKNYTGLSIGSKTTIKIQDIDWDQYLYRLSDHIYGEKDKVEYIIIRNLPNDDMTTVYRPKRKSNGKPYREDDFVIEDSKLYFAGEKGSKVAKFFLIQPKLEDNLENIARFGMEPDPEPAKEEIKEQPKEEINERQDVV